MKILAVWIPALLVEYISDFTVYLNKLSEPLLNTGCAEFCVEIYIKCIPIPFRCAEVLQWDLCSQPDDPVECNSNLSFPNAKLTLYSATSAS